MIASVLDHLPDVPDDVWWPAVELRFGSMILDLDRDQIRAAMVNLDGPTIYDQLVAERGESTCR